MVMKKKIKENSSLVYEEKKIVSLTLSERSLFRSLLINFSFTFFTLIFVWVVNFIVNQMGFLNENIYGTIIMNTLNIMMVLAIGQALAYLLFSIYSWIKEMWGEL